MQTKTSDKQIVLSVQQLFIYGAFLITFGASMYTFFKAIPKMDELNKTVNDLRDSNSRLDERIIALKDAIAQKK